MKGTMLDWALFYALERGFPVFPVKEKRKSPPITRNGCLDATLDEKRIRQWWTKNPTANIAIRTGVRFWVFDKDKKGQEMYERLVLAHGRFADTLQALTPNAGVHFCYALPDQAHIGTHAPIRPDDWGVGLDTRGTNGYVLVHPSVVPADDGKLKRYEWDGADGENGVILPADPWLEAAVSEEALRALEAARPRVNGASGARGGFQLPERIAHGTQHNTLVKYAGQLRARWLSEDEIFALLWKANVERCEKPGPEKDIRQYARSVVKYAPGPAHQPAPQREPVELPKRLSVGQVKALDVLPPAMMIESLFPATGLCLFTGAQKMGKTIFSAQTAVAVATNQALLGYYSILKPGPALIVEVDDPAGDASFKDLWTKWQVADDANVYLETSAPFAMGPEFLGWIESEIEDLKPHLVVLDSYLTLRPPRGKSSDIVHAEKEEMRLLDALAKKRGVLIVLLHHESSTNKANSLLDWDSKGAGTFALTAAVESQLSIGKFRELEGSPVRIIRAKGRHIAERYLVVTYNAETGSFHYIMDGPASLHYPLITDIKRSVPQAVITPHDLTSEMGMARSTAHRTLMTLINAGAMVKKSYGEYRFTEAVMGVR